MERKKGGIGKGEKKGGIGEGKGKIGKGGIREGRKERWGKEG